MRSERAAAPFSEQLASKQLASNGGLRLEG